MVHKSKKRLLALSLLSLLSTLTTQSKMFDYIPFKWFMGKKVTGENILEAIKNQESEENIIALIKKCNDLDFQDKNGTTLLLIATEYDNLPIIQMLLENGANPNIQDITGTSAITLAAQSNLLEATSLLIKYDADINLRDLAGLTALSYAVLTKNRKLATLLLANNANINNQDNFGKLTPIILAIAQGDIKMVNLLFENDADIYLEDSSGNNAIQYAKVLKSQEILKIIAPDELKIKKQDDESEAGKEKRLTFLKKSKKNK